MVQKSPRCAVLFQPKKSGEILQEVKKIEKEGVPSAEKSYGRHDVDAVLPPVRPAQDSK